MHSSAKTVTAGLLLAAAGSNALELNVNSAASIKSAAKVIAANVANIYNQSLNANHIPGDLPQPYYWWEGGVAFDSLINYWALTGDATYNDLVSQGLLWQVGPEKDYLPPNQTKTEGNDDQSFWALAAMTAAENDFPAPDSASGVKSWVELAENVFNTQAARWDSSTCKGGLRWQIFSFNEGYNYKNAGSNGNFLQLAARLAHYTGNSTYANWAQRTAEWSMSVGLIDSFQVFDGASITDNCSVANRELLTMNAATYLSGYAYMANYTTSSDWATDVPKFFDSINKTYVEDGILTEVICAATNNCAASVQAFRAIMARAFARAAAMVGSVSQDIMNVVRTSAMGAAGQCSGGSSGTACGANWNTTKYDGTTGLGQELSALEIILANLPAAKPDTETSATATATTAPSTIATSAPSGGASGSVSTTASTTAMTTTSGTGTATTSPSVAGDVKVSSLGGMAALGIAMAILA